MGQISSKNSLNAKSYVQDAIGAFADGAILFPIIVQLSIVVGLSGVSLLLSAGIAYLISGIVFRVPMPVQPLKSIAIAAVAMGASVQEVRIAACMMGIFCLTCAMFNVDQLAKRVPQIVVHGVQAALGVILVTQGLKLFIKLDAVFYPVVFCALALIMWRPSFKGVSVLGVVAVIGMLFAILTDAGGKVLTSTVKENVLFTGISGVRWSLVLGILLPQMALTLANSVIATKDVAQRYFGANSYRVTIKNLLYSIGVGNLLMSAVAGLPFCHGAGGLTAHYQAGARTWFMNMFIGLFLLGCAVIMFVNGSLVIHYSAPLLSILLVAIGLFHLKLAKPSWDIGRQRLKLLIMIAVAALTQNILWVLCVGIVLEGIDAYLVELT